MTDEKFPGFSDPAPQPLKKPGTTAGSLAGAPKLSNKPLSTLPSTAPQQSPAAPTSPVVDASLFEMDDKPSVKRRAAYPTPVLDPAVGPSPGLPSAGAAQAASPGAGVPPRGGSAKSAQELEDADIKPGMAKDLWPCPHCGARNKPTRSSCRECGKSPSDEIIVPWHKKPKNLAKIGGGVVAVILLFMLLTHVDTSLHVAGPGHLDKAVRLSGGGNGERSLGENREFHGRGMISVSGRVLYVSGHPNSPWITVVVLALGNGAVNDDAFNNGKVDIKEDGYVTTGFPNTVTLFVSMPDFGPLMVTKGSYLSVAGEYGDFYEAGTGVANTTMADHPNSYGILVKQHAEN